MRRPRIGFVGLVLLSAAALGESLAFLGEIVGASHLAWVGGAIAFGPVLIVLAKLFHAPEGVTDTSEIIEAIPAPDEDEPEDLALETAGDTPDDAPANAQGRSGAGGARI